MSLETDIILSLLDIKLWMIHHSGHSLIKIKKQKVELSPYLYKYASVNKRNLYKPS
ncbi:Uncharacterized protein BWINRA5_00175 [Bacillus mycoides]|uniref:hypothetical protein n=1 Tax=Bacillus mycoides TaxID=1405 RepID=UPI0008184E62|nr:hypothetical protein [Bacillus mycoides]SCA96858.1 Uncharacterized protein BWINRA5_00175 [Bacillus mycoides]